MLKDTPRSGLDVPVQVSDEGSAIVVLTVCEQWDLHSTSDGTGGQSKSFPSSMIKTTFTGPAPPPAPAMIDKRPLRAIEVVIQTTEVVIQDVINDNRHPEEEIEGRDGTMRDYTVAGNNGELDDEEVKAVRQDSCAARRAWVEYSSRRGAFIDVRARKASTDVTNDYDPDSDGKIGGECHTECYGTDVWIYGEESPSSPASDDASATGRTYDDVTKLPPPHLRYAIPVLRRTACSQTAELLLLCACDDDSVADVDGVYIPVKLDEDFADVVAQAESESKRRMTEYTWSQTADAVTFEIPVRFQTERISFCVRRVPYAKVVGK